MTIFAVAVAIQTLAAGPLAQASRIRVVPQNSSGLLQDLEESRDGSRLLTHDRGYAPRLWDARRHIVLAVLDGHPDLVANVAFTADGKRVISRSPMRVVVWDAGRARRIATLAAPAGDAFTAGAASPDGATAAFGTRLGAVIVGKAAEIGAARKVGGHAKGVGALAFSRDGTRFFSGADDGTGRIWDAKTGAPGWSTKAAAKGVAWADFSASGLLVTTLYDRKSAGDQKGLASVWDKTGAPLAAYPHWLGARSVDLTWGGAVFVAGDDLLTFGADGTMPVHKVGGTKPLRSLVGHEGAIRELRFSPDRKYVSTVADDEALYMWDAATGKKLPFDPGVGVYTAGDFSPTRPVFWLGYKGGDVRQFDLKTGKATKETFGAVERIDAVAISPGGRAVTLEIRGEVAGFGLRTGARRLVIDPTGAHGIADFSLDMDRSAVSPDGNMLAMNSRNQKFNFAVWDIWTDKAKIAFERTADFGWSADGTRIATLVGDEGAVEVFDAKAGKGLKSWKWPTDKAYGGIEGPAFHPNGEWLVTYHHPKNVVLLWDWTTGEAVRELGKIEDVTRLSHFSEDGKRLFVMGLTSLTAIDVATGAHLWAIDGKRYQGFDGWTFSDDESRIALDHDIDQPGVVIDAKTGVEIFSAPSEGMTVMSPDGKRLLTAKGLEAWIWDVDAKTKLVTLPHSGAVLDVACAGDRFVTVDDVRGMNVWDPKGKRLATVVAMKDGSWLVYDDEGRYDSSTPSDVRGAYYVLEWEGGLEPITMSQLKGQFYDPHLLAKALGIDKEPPRDVPDISALRLFPTLAIKPDGPTGFSIAAEERDDGGIGTVRVAINGKEVLTKKGAGFFKLDTKDYEGFLLPEVRLAEGEKNRLSVTVSNETGDLVSPPESVDLPVPAGLKAPEVRLFALCVGVGDYTGTAGDLQAPAADARAIAAALSETAGRLLPGRVQVDVLATGGDGPRPTRPNVLAWLAETAKKATSSDIVFVFAAGHGMSRIGDAPGYYLLTSEADPSDVAPAAAKTVTISGEELRLALSAIPAGKQVVVLDTCHSGAASTALLGAGRSVSGEYQRAWEAIKDTTGTWLLAGSASDQLSYESSNVEHGMLTYALLEAIDRASADGLRKAPSGELFLDVERWLSYASTRVESLKSEVGLGGVQRPEFKRSTRGESFDMGVMDVKRKGFLELKPPMPIVIVGDFSKDEEDPLAIEEAVATTMRASKIVKPWFDVAKHPGVYRMTGTYSGEGSALKVRVVLQAFDGQQTRKNLDAFEATGTKAEVAATIRTEVERRIRDLEAAKKP